MKCPSCEKEFVATTNKGYTKRYCSRYCANRRIYSKERKESHSEIMQKHFSCESTTQRLERISKASATKKLSTVFRLENDEFDSLSIELKRKRINIEQKSKCSICGCGEVWNKKRLIFELDHINGDRTNNTRDNLRLLCPNCHSQTETFVGRKKKKVSDEELLVAIKTQKNMHQICLAVGLQPCKKSYDRIKKLIF